MHDIAPILDIEIPVNSVDENLPTAVASLRMQAIMENKTEAECFEQKIAFWSSEFSEDIEAIYKFAETRPLFGEQERYLFEVWKGLGNILHHMNGRVHDKPSPANSAVRSTTRLSLVGGV